MNVYISFICFSSIHHLNYKIILIIINFTSYDLVILEGCFFTVRPVFGTGAGLLFVALVALKGDGCCGAIVGCCGCERGCGG